MVDPSIIPADEAERMNALRRYQILDTPEDGSFDRITSLVADLLHVPISIVSLVDNDRIWFKSHHGVPVEEIDRVPGLCATAILSPGMRVLPDTLKDPVALTNPLVAGDFGLRFYAAAPLVTHDGYNLGTLCALDFEPRELTAEQQLTLRTLATVVMDEMELRLAARQVNELHENLRELHEQLREQAAHDMLTGLWNRRAIMELLDQSLMASQRDARSLSVMVLDVDFFKKVNDTYGHPAGDEVLKAVSSRLSNALRKTDSIGRTGGEEFLAVLYPCDVDQAHNVAERCRKAICAEPILIEGENGPVELEISVSVGVFNASEAVDFTADNLIKRADAALYQSKEEGRNRVTFA